MRCKTCGMWLDDGPCGPCAAFTGYAPWDPVSPQGTKFTHVVKPGPKPRKRQARPPGKVARMTAEEFKEYKREAGRKHRAKQAALRSA